MSSGIYDQKVVLAERACSSCHAKGIQDQIRKSIDIAFLTLVHLQTQELFKCYPSLFPKALMAGHSEKAGTRNVAQKKESFEAKRVRQARHQLERVRKEAAQTKTVSVKKTSAMLMSPYTQSEPRNGIIYVTFEDNGVVASIPDQPEKSKVKKEKKQDDVVSDEVASAKQELSDMDDVVFAEDEEYAGNEEDDLRAVHDGDSD